MPIFAVRDSYCILHNLFYQQIYPLMIASVFKLKVAFRGFDYFPLLLKTFEFICMIFSVKVLLKQVLLPGQQVNLLLLPLCC